MGIKAKILCILLFCVSSIFGLAQSKITAPIEKYNGKEYYMHYVETGQTLYSISTLYKVTIALIQKNNPQIAKEGLQPDQIIRIPVTSKKTSPVVIKKQERIIDDEGYVIHTVKASETLYSLGKYYKVKPGEIIDVNPEVITGLSIGQRLRIPAGKEETSEDVFAENNQLDKHVVKKGETIETVSEKYKLSLDSMKIYNQDLINNGIKEGQVIYLPKITGHTSKAKLSNVNDVAFDFIDDEIVMEADSAKKDDVVRFALMLPIYVAMNDSLEALRKSHEKPQIYNKTVLSLDLYKGVKLAMDSLKKMGVKLELRIYDTDNDSGKVMQILKNPGLAKSDLIIGPLYKKNFEIVSAYAKKLNINMISPVPQSSKILLGNTHISKIFSAAGTQVKFMASHVAQNHNDSNVRITLVDSDTFKDHYIVKVFKQHSGYVRDTAGLDSIHCVKIEKLNAETVAAVLDTNVENVICIPSNNQSFVSEFLTHLHKYHDVCKITVYGINSWRNFSNLDVDYLHNLNIHITSNYYIDRHSKVVKKMEHSFNKMFMTYPKKYSFLGFDLAYYYGILIHNYKGDAYSKLDKVKHDGVSISFDFFQTGVESGFENTSVYLLKYEDFLLKRIQ